MMREYVVTLKDSSDLDEFYDDMETEGGTLYIPNRAVNLSERRPSSRNTHYMLTDEEAQLLANDPRVLEVSLSASELGLQYTPAYLTTQTSSFFDKSDVVSSTDINWGLLRCYEGITRPNWGNNGSFNVFGTINLTSIGRHVDVVVIDGLFNPAHPEFAVNHPGSGGSRGIQYNWFQHNPAVLGTAAGTYNYNSFFTVANVGNNNHGAHVAGTVAGNTQGWARAANIYNIYAYSAGTPIYDYVKQFHINKSINPVTGVKNPTICNMSYGFRPTYPNASVTQINYRGTTINRPAGGWTLQDLINYKAASQLVYNANFSTVPPNIQICFRYAPDEADIIDCINAGIIFTGAACNENIYQDVPGGPDYNNYMMINGSVTYYNRGVTPACTPGVINVGSIAASTVESKATYSNYGPRIDIFSPGTNIVSPHISGGVADLRDPTYVNNKISGTSMATPQVCGVLACALESLYHMNQADALQYLLKYCTRNQVFDGSNLTVPAQRYFFSLGGSPNRMLKYKKERETENIVYPKNNYNFYKTPTIKYPLTRVRRIG